MYVYLLCLYLQAEEDDEMAPFKAYVWWFLFKCQHHSTGWAL